MINKANCNGIQHCQTARTHTSYSSAKIIQSLLSKLCHPSCPQVQLNSTNYGCITEFEYTKKL